MKQLQQLNQTKNNKPNHSIHPLQRKQTKHSHLPCFLLYEWNEWSYWRQPHNPPNRQWSKWICWNGWFEIKNGKAIVTIIQFVLPNWFACSLLFCFLWLLCRHHSANSTKSKLSNWQQMNEMLILFTSTFIPLYCYIFSLSLSCVIDGMNVMNGWFHCNEWLAAWIGCSHHSINGWLYVVSAIIHYIPSINH